MYMHYRVGIIDGFFMEISAGLIFDENRLKNSLYTIRTLKFIEFSLVFPKYLFETEQREFEAMVFIFAKKIRYLSFANRKYTS